MTHGAYKFPKKFCIKTSTSGSYIECARVCTKMTPITNSNISLLTCVLFKTCLVAYFGEINPPNII